MKNLCLGSAMWGDRVDRYNAFQILDEYYCRGFRTIDTASNYPINSDPSCLHASEKILYEWVKCNGVNDLSIIYKFGSLINTNIPENDLSAENISIITEKIYEMYGANIDCLMVHWDNTEDENLIQKTLHQMSISCMYLGCKPGISGISNVKLYFEMMSRYNLLDCYIEAKSNFLYKGELKYSIFKPYSKVWAYGISCGGLKFSDLYTDSNVNLLNRRHSSYRTLLSEDIKNKINYVMNNHPLVENFYFFSLIFSELNTDTYGYILAPNSREQLLNALYFREKLQSYEQREQLFRDVNA